ncbi:MAG: hypothetical protein LBQ68_01240, partial [Clostridiales bacterium]|nr:hypothetical protein [Clostridiales bacterium]
MAVVNMKSFRLCAMQRDRKRILEFLQYKGLTEIKESEDLSAVFSKVDTQTDYIYYQKNSARAARATQILDSVSPRQKPSLAFLQGRKVLTQKDVESIAAKADNLMRHVERVIQLEEDIKLNKVEIQHCETHESILGAWLNLPVSESFKGTKKTVAFIGSLPGELTAKNISDLIGEQGVYIEIVHASIG